MSAATARRRTMSVPVPALLLCALLAACDLPGEATATSDPGEHRSAVRVATVERVEGERMLQLPGVLRAAQRAQPAFLQPGYLAERLVVRGERVTAGQPLATLTNPALGPAFSAAQARVRELDERLVQLEAEYQRMLELNTRGLASADQLDRALAARNSTRAAREQAVAGVAEAREQLGEATLRAPFDALVSDLLVEPGDFVQAGQPVLVLSGTGALEVEVKLPEGLSAELVPGTPARIRALASGREIDAAVRELGVAQDGRLAPAVLELASSASETSDWFPGLSVQAGFALSAAPALSVPLSAIVDPGTGRTRVYSVRDGRAVLTPVRVGRPLGARVEVSGELAAGDRVVVAGHQQLLDGDLLRILP